MTHSIVPSAIAAEAGALGGLDAWLAEGPIQDAGGGIVAWCDADLTPAYVYPEISGYLLTSLARRPMCSASHERVRRCADFLAGRVADGRHGARSYEDDVVYNFDLGMIATGLLRASANCGVDVLEPALALSKLLRDQIFAGPLRAVNPIGAPPRRGPKWSTEGALHLTKCTQALLLAAERGLDGAADAADRLVADAAARLEATEDPHTCPGCADIHLHAVLYCAEGLWIYGSARGSAVARNLSRDLTTFVLGHLDAAAGLPSVVGPSPEQEQGDVLAQLLRLVVLHDLGASAIGMVVARLRSLVVTAGRWKAIEFRKGSGHLNTWATIFASQAEALLAHGRHEIGWRDLA